MDTRTKLSRQEAAEYLTKNHQVKIAAQTLAKYAVMGIGPKFQKIGVRAMYPIVELDNWGSKKSSVPLVRSTSELAALPA
jgi:hypothetical protein